MSKKKNRPFWERFLCSPALWCVLLWAAWAIRLWQLDASDLTFDEAATYYVANRPLLDILRYLRGAVREHPPVFYLLIRPWISLAGTSEYSLRFFAAGASMVGITLTGRLAHTLSRRLGATRAGEALTFTTLPALILALFPFEVYYARDARMYTLSTVWAILSSLQFLPLLFGYEPQMAASRPKWPSPSTLVRLVFVNALALFTHYYLALFVFTQFVVLFLLRRWRAFLAWCVAHCLMGLVGVVWIARSPGLSSTMSEILGRFSPTWPTVGQIRRLLAELFFGPVTGVPWNLVHSWGALVILGLLVAWLLAIRARHTTGIRRLRGRWALAFSTWLTLTVILPVALAFLLPESPRSRFLIYVLPFAALALGQIPFILTEQKKVVAAGLGVSTLAICILGIFGLPRTITWIKSDYGHTVATIKAHARPGDAVLFYGPWQGIQFRYYEPDEFPPIEKLPAQAPPQLSPEQAEPVLHKLVTNPQRLWVIPSAVDDIDPAHFVEGWLNTHAHPVWTTPDLSLYLPPAQHEALSLSVQIPFGDRLYLQHLATDAQTVPAGEALRFTLTWTVFDALDSNLQLHLSLWDEWNRRWLQWERVPGQWANTPANWAAGDVITDRHGFIVPQGAPPGSYSVRLTVVDTTSGVPLGPSGTSKNPQTDIDLFSFQVIEPVTLPVLMDVDEFIGPFTFKSTVEANNALTLVGYGLGGLKFQQGNPIPLRLHWLAPALPQPDVELRLQLRHRPRLDLIGGRETILVTETLPLVPGYPVAEWPAGRLVSLPASLSIPGIATPGRADLTLTVLGPDGQPWIVAADQYLTLGTMSIEERPMSRQLPAGLETIHIDFNDRSGRSGDKIGLRGYHVDGEAQPGGRLDLIYAWYASSEPQRVYSVFNHLLTTDGQKITQADGWPQGGEVPTDHWRSGEYILDNHILEIPADAPPGPYLLAVGLYDAATGERLQAVHDGQPLPNDQWLLIVPIVSE